MKSKEIKWFQIKKWIDKDYPLIKFLALSNKVSFNEQYRNLGSPNIDKYVDDIINYYSSETKLDKWMIRAIADVSKYSNPLELFKIKDSKLYDLENGSKLVLSLVKIFANLRLKKIDTVIFVPWLKTGGADLHVVLLARSLTLNKKKCLVIATENTTSEWKDRIGNENVFINIGPIISKIPILAFINVFRIFLVAWDVKNIHVMNSHFGWNLLEKYGLILKKICKITTSLFCYDYTVYGEPIGYARNLDNINFEFDVILTDNTPFKDHLVDYYAVKRETIHTLRHPIEVDLLAPKSDAKGPILWAGRLDDQKNFPTLIKIAKKRPDLTFEVYGSSVTDQMKSIKDETSSEVNIIYKGPFSKLDEIPINKYSIFLYTSKWDGLPNIVLEMCAMRIPVICPRIGGLGVDLPEEFLNLVSNPHAVDEYIELIDSITKNHESYLDKASKAQIFVVKNFNFKNLLEQMKEIEY